MYCIDLDDFENVIHLGDWFSKPIFPTVPVPSNIYVFYRLIGQLRIEATSYNKNLRSAPESKEAWAKVLQRGLRDASETLDVRNINYDTLRLGRVRLDAMCCAAWRKYYHSLAVEVLDVYLYSDGSPQWRGVELLASTMDIRIPGTRGLRNKDDDGVRPGGSWSLAFTRASDNDSKSLTQHFHILLIIIQGLGLLKPK